MNFIGAGRALTIAGNTPQEYHLWLILTDPDPESGKVITVMVVSPKKHTDPTVLLVSGEHPFLKHDSHVDYRVCPTQARGEAGGGVGEWSRTLAG